MWNLNIKSCTCFFFFLIYSFDIKEVSNVLSFGTHTFVLHVAQTINPSNCYIFRCYVVQVHYIKVKLYEIAFNSDCICEIKYGLSNILGDMISL